MKPNFKSNTVLKTDLTSTLQRGAIGRVPDPAPVEARPTPVIERSIPAPARRQIESRKRKLAHLKTLLEFEEKKAITALLRDVADIVGHNIQFSVFNRGLLLAALARRTTFCAQQKGSPVLRDRQTATSKAFEIMRPRSDR